MPPTTSLADCKRFAAAITAAGGAVPKELQHLLQAHAILRAHGPTRRPEDAIMDAVLDGSLTPEKLQKLLPAAATASLINAYAHDLAIESEHVLVGAFHRALAKNDCIDRILDSLRPKFDQHAAAIAHARTLINPESTAEHIIESGEPELVTAWQQLKGHIQAITAIGAVASQFGCRPTAMFPAVTEYALADNFRVDDRALWCADGPSLVLDSAPFLTPDGPHRNSAWFRVPLKLHTLASAKARYAAFAAAEFDKQHSGPRGGWIDRDGQMHEDPVPENPYRRTKVST